MEQLVKQDLRETKEGRSVRPLLLEKQFDNVTAPSNMFNFVVGASVKP